MGDRTYYRLALPATLSREAIRSAAIAFTDGHWTDEDVTRLLDNARCAASSSSTSASRVPTFSPSL